METKHLHGCMLFCMIFSRYTVDILICGKAGAWGSIQLLNGLRGWALGSLGRVSALGLSMETWVLNSKVIQSIK